MKIWARIYNFFSRKKKWVNFHGMWLKILKPSEVTMYSVPQGKNHFYDLWKDANKEAGLSAGDWVHDPNKEPVIEFPDMAELAELNKKIWDEFAIPEEMIPDSTKKPKSLSRFCSTHHLCLFSNTSTLWSLIT